MPTQPKLRLITNPGGLPAELKPADLKKDHASLPRNPDVAHVCFIHGLIENIGRGTQRIVEDCKRTQLPEPKWQTSRVETTLTLFSAPAKPSAKAEELNERQRRILAAAERGAYLRPKELAQLVGEGVTDRTVRNDLQELVDRGLLLRRGRGRSTSYVAEKPMGR